VDNLYYREYIGLVFAKVRARWTRYPSVVDAALFEEINPNYSKPQFHDSKGLDVYSLDIVTRADEREKRISGLAQTDKEKLMVCSPTVLGFSLETKRWCKWLLQTGGLPN